MTDKATTAAHYAAQLAEAQKATEMEQLWIVIERLNRRVTQLEIQQPGEPLSTQDARIRQVLSGWAL